MSVHNDRGIKERLDQQDIEAATHQMVVDGDRTVAGLSELEAFNLLKWVIQNKPGSPLLVELKQRRLTTGHESIIERLEQSYRTPPRNVPRGYSPDPLDRDNESIGSVRRRLFEVEEEQEQGSGLSTFKVVLILGGAYVVYSAVVKPIFKQIKDYFNKDSS